MLGVRKKEVDSRSLLIGNQLFRREPTGATANRTNLDTIEKDRKWVAAYGPATPHLQRTGAPLPHQSVDTALVRSPIDGIFSLVTGEARRSSKVTLLSLAELFAPLIEMEY